MGKRHFLYIAGGSVNYKLAQCEAITPNSPLGLATLLRGPHLTNVLAPGQNDVGEWEVTHHSIVYTQKAGNYLDVHKQEID